MNTYEIAKLAIERKKMPEDELKKRLDAFLATGGLTVEEYKELVLRLQGGNT